MEINIICDLNILVCVIGKIDRRTYMNQHVMMECNNDYNNSTTKFWEMYLNTLDNYGKWL